MADNPWYEDGLRFSCTQCGNCCTGPPGYVWVTDAEAEKIAAHLHLSVAEFREQYMHRVGGGEKNGGRDAHPTGTSGGGWSLNEKPSDKGLDCVFLARDGSDKALCTIYEVRPVQCRTWPFWPEVLQSPAHWRRAAVTCPGVAAGTKGQGKFYPVEEIRIIRDRK